MRLVFSIALILSSFTLFSQGNVTGRIISETGGIGFAKILINKEQGIIADANGNFSFTSDSDSIHLRISATGYTTLDTSLLWKNEIIINLIPNIFSDPVVVTGTMREMTISESPVKIEVLNNSFFRLNPVNNVMEAVNLVNGVQEVVACGVCGTNDIHINGMEGVYTLVMVDGMPSISGLSSLYGLNGIPESIIDRVEIIKGPASTLYGTEAVGGVINIITKPNANLPLLEINSNATTHREYRGSIGFAPRLTDQISTALGADVYYNQFAVDDNLDNFTDFTLNERISLFNRWTFRNKKNETVLKIAGRYYQEDRFGGELQWTPEFLGGDSIYGESIITQRWEVFGTYFFPFKKVNLKLDFSANQHFQDATYGETNYVGRQEIYFANLIWQEQIKERHFITSGLTNRYQVYEDNTESATQSYQYIPAIFIQDEFKWTENIDLLTGARLDYHENHGLIFSPRVNLKTNFTKFSTLRLNYGTGFRQVNLFTEDHAFITGSRDVVLGESLNPEQSHNFTLDFNQTYGILGAGNFSADIFYTYFTNKIIPDYEQNPNLIVYENLDGISITQGISLSLNHSFEFPLSLRFGATFMDVFERNENADGEMEKIPQLFTPNFSGSFGANYNWKKAQLQFSVSGKINGPMELPTYDPPFERPDMSPWYTLMNLQITKQFEGIGLELYGGAKNLLNFTQISPLINPAEPFSDEFDTAYAFGPMQTRRYFIGLRWSLQRSKK